MKTIHLLPTDKPSRLLKTIPKGNLLLHKENVVGSHWENQKIYITNSEEIKEGFIEWFICHHGVKKCVGTIVRNNEVYLLDYLGNTDRGIWCKKIVITDNEDLVKDGVQAIDDEFLQWFVKNPSCEFVEIVKEKIILGKVAGTTYTDFNYKIIIPRVEPKQETLEEANWKVLGTKNDTFYNGAKWQERMYSEENIACEFAIFFNGLMPMNCKEIMRRQDLPNEEKVKLVFKEYLKTKENDTSNN